jgi:hypothetical protein
VLSINRSLLKGEAPGFSADFTHPLSCVRPFKFSRQLVPLGIDNIIAISDINIHSAIFNIDTDKDMDLDTDKDKDKDTDTDMDLELELEFFCKPYGFIVPIAPYGLPEPHHGAVPTAL